MCNFFKLFFIFFIFFIFISKSFAHTSPNLYTVGTQTITQTLYYSGTIAPISNTPVISPTAGVIDQKFFIYGQIVKKNQPLLHIESKKIQNDMRDARVAYLKSLDDYNQKLNWKNSDAVLNAEQSLLRAQRELTQNKNSWDENQKLYQLGIISHDALIQSQNSVLDAQNAVQQANRSYTAAIAQGAGDNLTMSKLALDNSKDKYDSLQAQVNAHEISSPADGIILEPLASQSSNSDSAEKSSSGKIDVGSSIEYQQVLMNIGDMSGLQISFNIPEININQINPGQSVIVTGSGFPGVSLQGVISEVGAQAESSGSGSLPTFPAMAIVKQLSLSQKKLIRSGMDAQLAIQVYQASNQISVPINSVSKNQSGQSLVKLYDPDTQKITDQIITTGKVTVSSIQVLSGLKIGQQIILLGDEHEVRPSTSL